MPTITKVTKVCKWDNFKPTGRNEDYILLNRIYPQSTQIQHILKHCAEQTKWCVYVVTGCVQKKTPVY